MMRAWQPVGSTEVTKIGWRTIVHKHFLTGHGTQVDADVINESGSSAALAVALTPDNKVIVARQFRAGPELIMDELPGGMVDKGEDPETAARRELLEETSYEAGSMIYLGKAYKDAWNNSVWHYFLATDCTKHESGQKLDDFEEIEVDLITIDQLMYNATHAKMTDGDAVLLAYEKLMELNKHGS